MNRRIVLVLLAVAGIMSAGTAAHAITSKTRRCVAELRSARSACSRSCTDAFRASYPTCFGPGSECATAAIGKQVDCLIGPSTAQQACIKDTPLATFFPGLAGGACTTALRDALKDCAELAPEAQPACAAAARVQNLECQNDCKIAFLPAISACNTTFQDDVGACASQR